ncbi:GSCOCG00007077001-RA-CDS [Cotesia congregata]|uniref:RNA polymerase II subunit B1 CTD phosphatase RPAP2 homolog n=1 Tax=Cotesia congregata TaxID=51543 RepID=A0A8J2MI76_COTCN|nr:GSCOCG00007077001-RA-CDS [Cotesia congregata]CAG5082562.1 Similar to rpap2: Putative RNA polymerase II subunit B1 CTD phosphatase rpap2 (Danio rerio) [Cotesia congregata]
MNTKSSKARMKRANQIKAAKAAKSMPTAILLKKKEETDAKALSIVEKLIEPQVDVQWMLDNLQHINRSHMEDVAEERAIIKICGYVLCDNPLTKVVNKKYSISAMRNKIYNIEEMKNYCCFTCHSAMTYILLQMLTSPLWLRNYEEIPMFKIKEKNTLKRDETTPGIEINIAGIQFTSDDLPKKKFKGSKTDCQTDEESEDNEINYDNEDGELDRENGNEEEVDREDDEGDEEKLNNEDKKLRKNLNVKDRKIKDNIDSLTDKLKKVVKFRDKVKVRSDNLTNNSVQSSSKITRERNINDSDSNTGVKRERQKTQRPFSEPLTERLEKNFRELITAHTIKFLLGEKTEKQSIVKNIKNQERYARLCERLDKLDIDLDEPETSAPIDLRPAPHFEVLQEQANDLVIKVNAFFKGNIEIETPVNDTVVETPVSDTVIPLTDDQAPNAMRRRLLLEKLDKVIPDLLPTLSYPGGIEYDYTVERITAIKLIVSTFNLTAKNIVFKTNEWVVVGLLMIKMLAFHDELINSLLATKHAASQITMLLLSYDLESDYLDSLIKLLIIESDKK